MHDLETGRPPPGFTETTQPGTDTEIILLRFIEVEEPQYHRTGIIRQVTQQAAASTAGKLYLAMIDGAFDQRLLTELQRTERRDSGTVLITHRQVKQHILDVVYLQAF